MKHTLFCCVFFSVCFSPVYAEKVIWSGPVSSDGKPTETIPLKLEEQYQIRVSGFVNLGKWRQGRDKLANDACYEFSPKEEIEALDSFKSSSGISVCDGTYHQDHVYLSKPFIAKQNKIHFWIYDTDYEDNTGELKVEVIQNK